MPSPLAQHALDRGFPSNLIFTPERAGEVIFYHLFVGNDFSIYSLRVIHVVTRDVLMSTMELSVEISDIGCYAFCGAAF